MARVWEQGGRGKLHTEFNSVKEVFKTIDKLGWKPGGSTGGRGTESDGRRDSDFQVFNSLAEAREVFENHPEKIRMFDANDARLESVEAPGKDVFFDVTGDYIDIDRFLEGVPESMGNAVLGNPRTVFCTINVLGSYVWSTSPEYQMQKQKRILRLVDWLETQNIRCQVVVTEDSDVSFSSVTVKEFHDPFDLNPLAVVMHPDWLRRIMFLIMEQSKTWSWGYGSSLEYDKRMIKYRPNPEDGLYVYVGGYMPYEGKDSRGYRKNNDLDQLNEAFDKIEERIERMILDGESFVDEPLAVTGNSLKGW